MLTKPFRILAFCLILALLASCARHEDEYTGEYRQVSSSEDQNSLQIDLIRFGNYASAFLRVYEEDSVTDSQFGEQATCLETTHSEFKENRSFDLIVQRTARFPRLRLRGKIQEEKKLEASLFRAEDGQPVYFKNGDLVTVEEKTSYEYERDSESPTRECESVPGINVGYDFPRTDTDQPQRLPGFSNYNIEHPVTVLWWTGYEERQINETTTTTETHALRQTSDLTEPGNGIFNAADQSFSGQLFTPITEPPGKVTVPSGDTEFAIGHFLLIDKQLNDDQTLSESLTSGDSNVVGHALRRGTLPSCPADTQFWGPALLFVKGDPGNLGSDVRELFASDGASLLAEEDAYRRHFLIVEVCASATQILQIQLPNNPDRQIAPIYLTADHLNATEWPVPNIRPRRLQ